MDVADEELQDLYAWVDGFALSRTKRNIARDFSDGVLLAELIHQHTPKLVDLHNYSAANAMTHKLYNWSTLNKKVFKRMGFDLARSEWEAVAACEPKAIERVLKLVKTCLAPTVLQQQQQAGCAQEYEQVHQMSTSDAATLSGDRDGSGADGAIARNSCNNIESSSSSMPIAGVLPSSSNGNAVMQSEALDRNNIHAAGEAEAALKAPWQAVLKLQQQNEMLASKVQKLEQLVRLKEAKAQTLLAKLHAAGLEQQADGG